MKQVSLKQLTSHYVLLVLGITFLVSFVSIYIYIHQLVIQQQQKESAALRVQAHSLSNLVAVYTSILKKLAVQPKVSDTLLFGSKQQAEDWAVETQQLLPGSVGVALLDTEGRLHGRPLVLRLGDQCLLDLHDYLQHKPVSSPPVHTDIADLAHFDVIQNVYQDGLLIGLLFSSFSLDLVQNELDYVTRQNQYLSVVTKTGQVIASSGDAANKNAQYETQAAITGTDWTLKASINLQDTSSILAPIGFSHFILFLLVSILFFVFAQRLRSATSRDFETIKEVLPAIYSDGDIEVDGSATKLSETSRIVGAIQLIAREMNHYQEKLISDSNTDELTGVRNRRAFNNEIQECINLAQRGLNAILIITDIDHFKQVNDTYGHVAGDLVLKVFGSCLLSRCRAADVCARLGGDEFVVVLMQCDLESAKLWYSEFARYFRSSQIRDPDLKALMPPCTLSAGCTEIQCTDSNIDDILARADNALYMAKQQGRDNIQFEDTAN